MSEVRGPLAEVREHGRLDGLDALRLLGVVGDAVLRAVGVRDEERPLAVVAAPGAQRHLFFWGAGPVVGFLELAGPVVLDERCDIDLARLLDFCASSARRGSSRGPS